MGQALEGITVVDFSHVVAGPLATHFLALNGARVIKIEQPTGDPLRNYTANRDQAGMAPAFKGINLGKESVVLDLKSKHGHAEAKRLVAQADIVVENFRPGVMARLGLDYDTLRADNPGLIYCAVSGFGQTGAMCDVAAIDQIVQSLSGVMTLSGMQDDPAMRVGFPIVDTFTGLLAAFAIQTALVQRDRGKGIGQCIDVAMLDASLVMLLSVVNPLLMAGETPMRTGNRGFSRAPTADTFTCADGDITIGAVEDAQVVKLLEVLDLSHLLTDPAYATRIARIENADAMHAVLARAFATRQAKDWEARLQAVGLPAARVLNVEQALALPHLADRDLIMNVQGDRVLNAGFQFRHDGPGINRGAPELGAHTDTTTKPPAPGQRRRA
ncbi:MAG: CaiB/BaiF CoA transferase family protein [Pseudooceanicola sp.]